MKRCPKCDSRFPDTDRFCELDGRTLLPDYADGSSDVTEDPGSLEAEPVEAIPPYQVVSPGSSRRQSLMVLAVIAVAGLSIGVLLFVIYLRLTRETPEQSSNQPTSNEAVTQQQMPYLPSRPSPSPSESPSPEPSPSPSVSPSPAIQPETAAVSLSSSPVSTGGDEKAGRGQVVIRLTNGTTIEADEAWETGEGIWYRRRGVVALLERHEVKAIEKPATSPAGTPTSSPTALP